MANVVINDTNLYNIAGAIREKNGLTDTYKPSEMADAIIAIPTGGGEEKVLVSGDAKNLFMYDRFNDQLNKFILNDVSGIVGLFSNCNNLENIPFDINLKASMEGIVFKHIFLYCNKLKQIPKFSACQPSSFQNTFEECYNLVEIPEGWSKDFDFTGFNNSSYTTNTANNGFYGDYVGVFSKCRSLRYIDSNLINHLYSKVSSSSIYKEMFYGCNVLDKIENLKVQPAILTSNKFSYTFSGCCRLQKLTFETNEDGTPIVAEWKSQTIDLTGVGYFYGWSLYQSDTNIASFTDDTKITDMSSYVKNQSNPNRWATSADWSLYGSYQANQTLKSLPDTSAYITANGGTNTIKFKQYMADGYSQINSTSLAEGIAVAAERGWTVSIA